MSSCRIKRNLATGPEKPTDAAVAKELNDKLTAMIAEREKQDKNIVAALTDKEYEEKYGKQPAGKDPKAQ
ncbi:MAG: hypothetical protein EBY22_15700 [Gammaproteobacteria bacterium]|jgi:hypothetical protein|nr:hypothetical protein [Gammaproteobacteria bacterium]